MVGLDPIRYAKIDSASKHIKLGRAQFELLASEIVDNNPGMKLRHSETHQLYYLEAEASCTDFEYMGYLTFDFDGTTIDLMPEDYLEQEGPFCTTLIATDNKHTEHVSLGAAFLKSAYVSLDFDRNEIAIAKKDVKIPESHYVPQKTDDDEEEIID